MTYQKRWGKRWHAAAGVALLATLSTVAGSLTSTASSAFASHHHHDRGRHRLLCPTGARPWPRSRPRLRRPFRSGSAPCRRPSRRSRAIPSWARTPPRS